MPDPNPTGKGDLVARVATLELLVSDLIHILWQVSPATMNSLAGDAAHDLEIGRSRMVLPVGEAQREQLRRVLLRRQRMLRRKPAQADDKR